jgi:hypothetical protein
MMQEAEEEGSLTVGNIGEVMFPSSKRFGVEIWPHTSSRISFTGLIRMLHLFSVSSYVDLSRNTAA